MSEKDLNEIGERISRDLKEALDSMDFSKLNETVTETVNVALKEAKESTRKAAEEAKETTKRAVEEVKENIQSTVYRQGAVHMNEGPTPQRSKMTQKVVVENPSQRNNITQVEKNQIEKSKVTSPDAKKKKLKIRPQGNVAGVLCTTFGSIGLFFGITFWMLASLAGAFATTEWAAITTSLSWVFLLLSVGFGVLLGVGIHYVAKNRRLKRYAWACRGKEYISIEDLARASGKKKDYVVKDIKKMLEVGMLPESHMDDKNTCLIFTKEAYQQYLEAKKAYELRQEEEKRIAMQKEEENKILESSDGLRAVVERGNEFLKKIQQANDKIPGAEISEKINRLESIVRQILKAIKENPEEVKEMDKFMEYYLPTTVKLLEAYQKFDQISLPGENVISAKREIEKTLDTIEKAFAGLLDDLYQNTAFDAEADAAVLKTMLEQEGLMS